MPFAIVGPAPTEIEAALGLLYTQTVEKAVEFRGELTLYIKPDSIVAVCRALKNHPDLHFDMLSDLTAVDHLNDQDTGQPRFHVVYQLFSTKSKKRLRLKCAVDEENPQIDSVTPVWCGANWHERECFDMFGILFKNHPNPCRILMPEDWEGHPLRKDFPVNDQEPYEYLKKQLADE